MITAIVPLKAYHEPYLRAAFASLFAQTAPAWQAIVVVEPAELATFRTVLAGELGDARVQLVANEGRQLAGAINTGIRAATTAFVAILLADDLWDAASVAVLTREIAAHPDADFLHSARQAIDDDGRPCSGVMPARHDVRPERFVHGSAVKHLLCFRRATALAVGGLDESINSVGPDDYDFPWTMAEAGARFHPVEECLYLYRDHRRGYRLTTHLPRSVHTRELVRILRKHGVGWVETIRRVRAARRDYLKQCLYRNRLHRWMIERLGIGTVRIWREPYR